MKNKLLFATTSLITLGFTSCADMTHEQRRAAQGAAAGAAVGGIIGNQSGNAAEGALLGGAAGGAGGYLYGRQETGR